MMAQSILPQYARYDAEPASTSQADVRAYVHAVLAFYGLAGWYCVFDRAKRRLGQCRTRKKQISLSVYFLALNSTAEVRKTVLHEVAHALTPGHGHYRVWVRVARMLGDDGERLACGVQMVQGRWRADCPQCGPIAHRHKRPKRPDAWSCHKCGRIRGKITWVDTGA